MLGQPGQSGVRRFGHLALALLAALLLAAGLVQPSAAQTQPLALSSASPITAAPASTATTATDSSTGPRFPQLTGRVVDAANVIPADAEARLDSQLAGLEAQSRRQLVVVTLASLNGYEISDYGYQLGRAWGIGSKDKNDGALLIVAPNERKLRIEVGYGLEPVLTDGLSSLIISQQIVPKFKAGDMPGGIEAGADAIIAQLGLPAEEARRIAQQAQTAQTEVNGGDLMGLVFFGFIFLFVFVIPILRSFLGFRRKRYGTGGLGSVILWNVVDGISRGSSSSGGGGFGGGFSGGGGSFGGGGASGSW